jgi:hypothetical protein
MVPLLFSWTQWGRKTDPPLQKTQGCTQRARVQEAVLYNKKYISDLIALHLAGQNTDSARSHTSHLSKHLTRLIDNNRINELVLYVGIRSQVVEESAAQVVEASMGKS